MFRKQLIRLAQTQVLRSWNYAPYSRIMQGQKMTSYFSSQAQEFEFKAETKKLLDIVAKSLYTDKDVFIRELLSNASDALEKQRFLAAQQGESEGLEIQIKLDEERRVISIQDSGVGMTRQEMIDNLGTIARSGSRQFLQDNKNDASISDKIIGQFGVGFYSAFIVGDTVEVTSRSEKEGKVHVWTSDGSGRFTLKESEDTDFGRGTRIDIFLKPDCAQFSKRSEIEKTVQRYSNFISFPISLNAQRVNLVQAIWSRGKSDVSAEEYSKFYEYISNSKMNYRYKLHYHTDAPLSIKALMYVPQQHGERFGMSQEEFDLHLYSRKVLIKRNCREILPNYLRFIKGVVDCEDLPLNISRESYQDSALIAKLRSILTRRLIKEIESEANKDPDSYLKWYEDFQFFLKEGVVSDEENTTALLPLLRFQHNRDDGQISLEQYISMMKPGQDTIYYLLAPSRDMALNSPYLDPFRGTEIPVLFTYIHIDEMVFRKVDTYKNFKFVNVESEQQELQKLVKEVHHDTIHGLPYEEVGPFSMWLKNELAPNINQVLVSKRLKDAPAVVVSPYTSGMRQVMGLLDKNQQQLMNKNLTLEINPNHPIIVQLNITRKSNQKVGGVVAQQLLDNCLLINGLMTDQQQFVKRTTQLMELVMSSAGEIPQVESVPNTRPTQPLSDTSNEVLVDEHGNPSVKK